MSRLGMTSIASDGDQEDPDWSLGFFVFAFLVHVLFWVGFPVSILVAIGAPLGGAPGGSASGIAWLSAILLLLAELLLGIWDQLIQISRAGGPAQQKTRREPGE